MTETNGQSAARSPAPPPDDDAAANVDWIAAERSPEFKELVTKKRAFVLPATIFFLAWYLGFIVLAGYAPDFFGREFLIDGITVGYAFALSQFVMVWVLTWAYLRRADRVFDPLAKRAAERALEAGDQNGTAGAAGRETVKAPR